MRHHKLLIIHKKYLLDLDIIRFCGAEGAL